MNWIRLLARLLLGKRLPRLQGRLTVGGLKAGLTIRRDRYGIPVIEAASERDAFFGLGFCHGQDRTFQLEVLLRVVRGTLCEVVGVDALPIDRLCRRIGFHRSAERQLDVLPTEVRDLTEAYAAGVRAGQTTGMSRRPHEFFFLGSRPTPWTAADSLGVVKLISFTLSSNWASELVRLRILREDGEEALRALDPTYPSWQPVAFPIGAVAGASLDQLTEELGLLKQVAGIGGGSNNWVVGPGNTATGRPLLACDPHLEASIPGHWYLVHLRYPGGGVAGASFLGGPGIMTGHNGHAAWGLTAGHIDNTDLFLEQLGADGRSYRQGDTFHPCTVHEEQIAIKGKSAVTEVVLETSRGPILTGALAGADQSTTKGTDQSTTKGADQATTKGADQATIEGIRDVVSLRARWLDPLPIRGLLLVHRAQSFAEFRDILSDWPVTPQNMVYADAAGNIGWQLAGQAPRRKFGRGALPLPGWDDRVGWEPDIVPWEEIPHALNPREGYLATANTRPLPEGQGPDLSVDWIDGYRLQAIITALAARHDWSVPATLSLQTDQHSIVWSEISDIVLSIPADTHRLRVALDLLRAWDGVLSLDAPAGSVFELLLSGLACRLARAKAPKTWETAVGKTLVALCGFNFFCFRRSGHLVRLLREQPAGWFAHGWPAEIRMALEAAIATLEERAGSDPKRWGWGRVRPVLLHHPLGRHWLLAAIFNRGPLPWGGDTDTINQATVLPFDPLAPTNNIASLRTVIDVGVWSNSRFVLPGGQSGNPFSPHYEDQLGHWQRGDGVPIPWTAEEIASCPTVLTLEPS
jgi:penicillin amidase